MKIIKLSALLLFFGFAVQAQNAPKGNVALSSVRQSVEVVSTDTIKILAVMAEFQVDGDNTTVGNGTFASIYSKDYGKSIVDPLPHDRNYFKAHLEFVKNYYQKVSNGKLVVEFEVLPNGVTLSKTMRNYSPPINSTDFRVMGDFMQETWTLADQANPGFNFAGYDLFLIFHAGVGRDVSLPGSLGNERDLPSIYFNLPALQKFYGGTFDGVPVSGGAFKIQNTGILPQTQNREVTSFNSTFLYKITMNGLLASTVGSHLGLPDLFDTNTGLSAIGRFGLMDGQSIFAYNGAFPPAPSPWEKMRLGWETPVELKGTSFFPRVITRTGASVSDTTLLKLRINESEYFLIENRQRDANKDGAKVTLWDGTGYVTKTYLKDTTGFASFSIDSLYGVIVDIDEYDWALPGSGILVWHIDEKVINAKIADNKVNTDKKRRGVAVVEADGINDIGEKFYTIFGDEVVGEGTEYDLWFAENKADLYKNVFSNTSRPNTKTNDGANSLITMKEFTANANRMQMHISLGDSLIKPLIFTKLPQGYTPRQVIFTQHGRYFHIGYGLIKYPDDFSTGGGAVDLEFSAKKIAVTNYSAKDHMVGAKDNLVKLGVFTNVTSVIDTLTLPDPISADPLIVSGPTEVPTAIIGLSSGAIYRLSLAPFNIIEAVLSPKNAPITHLFASKGTILYIQKTSGSFYNVGSFKGNSIMVSGTLKDAFLVDEAGGQLLIVLEAGNKIKVFKDVNGTPAVEKEFTLRVQGTVEEISISDTKKDGNTYINYVSENELYSVNLSNSIADNFPVEIPASESFAGRVIAADFLGTGHPELIGFSNNGSIYAYDGKTGKLVDGFPLAIGDTLAYTPTFTKMNDGILLHASGKSGLIGAWNLNIAGGTVYFSGSTGNDANTGSATISSGSKIYGSFFPENAVYNYPNPATGTETFIRFYVDEDSDVTVKIFDLAGDFVADLKGYGQGGMDGEIRWDIRNIQSGVYLANVEATSVVSGKTGHKVIKIAIIK